MRTSPLLAAILAALPACTTTFEDEGCMIVAEELACLPPEKVSTIDLRVDYLQHGEPERIVCESTVVRLGHRVASVDMRVFQTHQTPHRLVATGKGVYNVKRGKPSLP